MAHQPKCFKWIMDMSSGFGPLDGVNGFIVGERSEFRIKFLFPNLPKDLPSEV